MSKFYLDFEFIEGPQDKRIPFLGIKYGKTTPTIDMISVGIVSEFLDEYYAVSKEFNLKEAWYRYQEETNKQFPMGPEYHKVYWLRENVLKAIHKEFVALEKDYLEKQVRILGIAPALDKKFTYKNFKRLLNKYGKTRQEIAEEIKRFIYRINPEYNKIVSKEGEELGSVMYYSEENSAVTEFKEEFPGYTETFATPIEFYGWYCDYDWVVFCWLFGLMIDLPSGFPMYCKDLKQDMDALWRFRSDYKDPSHHPKYPIQKNEHNALDDAAWTRNVHLFIMFMKMNISGITKKAEL